MNLLICDRKNISLTISCRFHTFNFLFTPLPFLIYKLLFLFFFLCLSFQTLNASPIEISQKEHILLCLPLLNISADPLLDDLAVKISKSIVGPLRDIGYVFQDTSEKSLGVNRDKIPLQIKEINLEGKDLKKITKSKEVANFFVKENNAQYMIMGNLAKENGNLVYNFILLDSLQGKEHAFKIKTDREHAFDSIHDIVFEVSKKLWFGKIQKIFISTPKPGALVYFDHLYLGQTPLTRVFLMGDYNLKILQGNELPYEKKISLSSQELILKLSLSDLESKKKSSILNVSSTPSKAKVYLNQTFIGLTPLSLKNIEVGNHRLRISKEKYIDEFRDLELKPQLPVNVQVNLSEGDTKVFYDKKKFAYGKTTYKEVALHSFASSAVFFGGFLFFDALARKGGDAKEPNQREIMANNQYAILSAGVSLVMFIVSGAILIKSLYIDYNLSFLQNKTESTTPLNIRMNEDFFWNNELKDERKKFPLGSSIDYNLSFYSSKF